MSYGLGIAIVAHPSGTGSTYCAGIKRTSCRKPAKPTAA
jgi:hypothetical protein